MRSEGQHVTLQIKIPTVARATTTLMADPILPGGAAIVAFVMAVIS